MLCVDGRSVPVVCEEESADSSVGHAIGLWKGRVVVSSEFGDGGGERGLE